MSIRSLLALSLVLVAACQSPGSLPGQNAYRGTEWGDRYYPGTREALSAEIDRALKLADPTVLGEARPQGLLVPHAGYSFSANTLGQSFGALQGHAYDRVIIVGQSHRHRRHGIGTFPGAALPAEKGFQLSTGRLDNDLAAIERLERDPLFTRRARPFDGETAIEPLLPFVRDLWPNARLLPILIGRVSPDDITAIGQAIHRELDGRTLLVISTTFTHFHARDGHFPVSPDKDATLQALRDFEAPFVQLIEQRDPKAVVDWIRRNDLFLCGTRALLVGMTALGQTGGAQTVAKDWSLRDDKGPLDPKWTSGVSYRGIVFIK